jgi:uncharacterized DUF497 family protein
MGCTQGCCKPDEAPSQLGGGGNRVWYPLAITVSDPNHSFTEQRELTFGCCSDGRLLVVAHTERSGRMRLTSARLATPRERTAYEQGTDDHA